MRPVAEHSRYLSSHLDPAQPGHPFPVMRARELGATGLRVPELGMDLGPLSRRGFGAVPDFEALEMLEAALDRQAGLLLASPSMGAGRGLALLGRVLQARRKEALVCLLLKPAGLRASLEAALQALGTGAVDLLLLEEPAAEHLMPGHPVWEELSRLRAEGKARVTGASLASGVQLAAALAAPAQALAFPFNALRQEASAAFALAAERGVGLLARRVLEGGFLAGQVRPLAALLRGEGPFLIRRRRALQAAFEAAAVKPGWSPAQAALGFVLAHPAVSTALPAPGSWKHVVELCAASLALESGEVGALRALWGRELKDSPLPLPAEAAWPA